MVHYVLMLMLFILTFVLSLHLPSNKIDAIAWAKINTLNIAYIENFK